MSRSICGLLLFVAVTEVVAGPAPGGTPAAIRTVVLAPLATLGVESSADDVKRIQKALASAVAAAPAVALVSERQMLDAIRSARRPELRSCDGQTACLAELATLVRADYTIYGELGGLGDAKVVYLKLVNAPAQREVRATVLELGPGSDTATATRAAVIRLLAPERHVGQLRTVVDVPGARIYVDGNLVGTSPAPPLPLPVGTHALRVTHAEFRDFVRFLDVRFASETTVKIDLQQFPVVASEMRRTAQPAPPPSRPGDTGAAPPWYRRWYSVAGFGAVVLVSSAALAAALQGDIDADQERTVRR